MAKRKAGNKKTKQAGNGENGGIVSLTKELFQAAKDIFEADHGGD